MRCRAVAKAFMVVAVTLLAGACAKLGSHGESGSCAYFVHWQGQLYKDFGFAAKTQHLGTSDVVRPSPGGQLGTGHFESCGEGGEASPSPEPLVVYAVPSADPHDAITTKWGLLLIRDGAKIPPALIREPR
jgi:hypothetical protein